MTFFDFSLPMSDSQIKFEAFAKTRGLRLDRYKTGIRNYRYSNTARAWEAWQEAVTWRDKWNRGLLETVISPLSQIV